MELDSSLHAIAMDVEDSPQKPGLKHVYVDPFAHHDMDVDDPPSKPGLNHVYVNPFAHHSTPPKPKKKDVYADPFAPRDPFTSPDPFAPCDPFAQPARPWWEPDPGEHTLVEAGLSAWAPWWAMAIFRLLSSAWLFGFATFAVKQRPSQLLSLDVLNHYTLGAALLLLGVCSAHGANSAYMRWVPATAVALYHTGASFALFIAPFGITVRLGHPLFYHPTVLTWVPPAAIFLIDSLVLRARVRTRYAHVWLVLAAYFVYFVIFVALSFVAHFSGLGNVSVLLITFLWLAICSAATTALTHFSFPCWGCC